MESSHALPNTPSSPVNTAENKAPTTLQRSLKLMKAYTWFAPAWSFVVGAIASHSVRVDPLGNPLGTLRDFGFIALGTLMAGPLLTGFSQVLNEWCDREVDAINQPERPIPSGLVKPRQVHITIAVLMVAALGVALILGVNVFWTALFGVALALGYSIEPFRFKRNGWIGNLAVGIAYESLGWVAGHLAFDPTLSQPWGWQSITLALIYGLGAHGIMTINDFKSVFGDRIMGLKSIPAMYGEERAAKIAVVIINAAQLVATALLFAWGHWIVGLISLALIALQVPQQIKLIQNPKQDQAVRYNIVAIPPYVWGMLAAAIGLGF
jgi:chlorophyll/bacteriochlorophyll a synthase